MEEIFADEKCWAGERGRVAPRLGNFDFTHRLMRDMVNCFKKLFRSDRIVEL